MGLMAYPQPNIDPIRIYYSATGFFCACGNNRAEGGDG